MAIIVSLFENLPCNCYCKIEPPLESSKKSFTPLTFEKKFDSPFFRLPPDHLNFDLSLTLTCMFFYFRLRQV